MTDTLKLHEITPFLISRSMKIVPHTISNDSFSTNYYFSDDRRWFDQTSVTLKLTRMPSISAMELTLKFLSAFPHRGNYGVTAIEESAAFVYDLYSAVLSAKTLGQEEINLSQLLTGHSFDFLVNLVNGSKAFLVLEQSEEPVSKPKDTLLWYPDLPKGSKAVKRSITLEFA